MIRLRGFILLLLLPVIITPLCIVSLVVFGLGITMLFSHEGKINDETKNIWHEARKNIIKAYTRPFVMLFMGRELE